MIPRFLSLLLALYGSLLSAVELGTPQDKPSPLLTPFTATYRAKVSTGLPFRQTASRQLKQLEDKSWLYSFQVKTLGASLYETSHFTLLTTPEGARIVPMDYGYHLKGWAVTERTARLSFNHQTGTVLNNVQNQPWQMKVPEQVQDKLSLILQVRLALMEGKTHLQFPVADGGLLKTYSFEVIREEFIHTGRERLETLVIRKSKQPDDRRPATLWLDKNRQLMLVKLVQEEESGDRYEIFLDQALFDPELE